MPRNYSIQAVEDLIVHLLHEHPVWEWRSVHSLAKEIGCSVTTLECHLDRMADKDVVVQHRSNECLWGAVTRVGRGRGSVQPVLDPETFEPKPKPDMFQGLRDCITEANKSLKVATALADQVASWKLT
jgi:hypothetical protein